MRGSRNSGGIRRDGFMGEEMKRSQRRLRGEPVGLGGQGGRGIYQARRRRMVQASAGATNRKEADGSGTTWYCVKTSKESIWVVFVAGGFSAKASALVVMLS